MSRLSVLAFALTLTNSLSAQEADRTRLDADRFHFARVAFDAPMASESSNRDEYQAYCDTLAFARRFPTTELLARGEPFVSYRDLVGKSARSWQYELLRFDLRLKSCRPFPAPRLLQDQGVPTLYECWLFVPPTDHAVCLVVSELPPGLEPAMSYPAARPVRAAGYFFKQLQYESRERDPDDPKGGFLTRRAPLLLGHSFELAPDPDAVPPEPLWANVFFLVAFVTVFSLGGVALGTVWYYRRSDAKVRAALADKQASQPLNLDPS